MKILICLLGMFPCWLRAQEEAPVADEVVEPMTLQDCQLIALKFSPSLARQRLSYSNLVESVSVAKSIYDPSLQIRRAWEKEEDPKQTRATLTQQLPAQLDSSLSARQYESNGEEYSNYALNLSKTLIGGGSFLEGRLPMERAWIQKAIEANKLSLEQRRLSLNVTKDYYAVLRNRLTLRLREQQLERAKRNLEHAMIKEDPLDIATAKLRIPESELDVVSAKRAISNGRLTLTQRIGLPVSQPVNVNTQLVFEVRAIQPEQDLILALEEHETILNARLDLELNHMEAKVARTRAWPELRAEATWEETNTPSDTTSDVRAELVLELPWLDRKDRAEARQRENELKQSELALFEAQQEVEQNLKSMAVQVMEAERSVVLQRERVEVLKQQFRLYQDRWDNGEINILEFIRSQNDLENAAVQLVTEQTRYLELRAEYDFNIGK
ncbi:TolC family protein [Kiritimatiellaeota bacterium B1221]|nr:TolC family protein [Kiritimatiellaeota bacterium B1221]